MCGVCIVCVCVCLHKLFKWKIVAAKFKRFWNLVILLFTVIAPSFVFGCWFCIFFFFFSIRSTFLSLFRSVFLLLFILASLERKQAKLTFHINVKSKVYALSTVECVSASFYLFLPPPLHPAFISSILKTENCQSHCCGCGSGSVSIGYWAHFVSWMEMLCTTLQWHQIESFYLYIKLYNWVCVWGCACVCMCWWNPRRNSSPFFLPILDKRKWKQPIQYARKYTGYVQHFENISFTGKKGLPIVAYHCTACRLK